MTPEERARKIAPSFFIGGALQDELADAIANALRTARNEALEEAAKVADKISFQNDVSTRCDSIWQGRMGAAQDISTAIRALKATTPSGSP